MGSKSIKWLTAISGLVFVLISLLISLYHLAYLNKIYPFISLGGAELSNLTLGEAERKLTAAIPLEPGEIKLIFENQEWRISLKELALIYNPRVTAEKIFLRGRSQGFLKDLRLKWQQWWQKAALQMIFELDQEKLSEQLETISKAVEEPAIMPLLNLTKANQVEVVAGKNGRLVDKEKLWRAFLARVGEINYAPLIVSAELVEIEVSPERLAQAQLRAEIIKDKILELKAKDFSKKIKGQELIDLINISNHNQGQGWDEVKVATLAAGLAQSLDRPSQNAVFQFELGRVVEFKPALSGLEVNQAETVKKIVAGLNQLEGAAEKTLPLEIVIQTSEPKIKTEQVNQLGIKELIGRGESTFHGSIASREHNIALTAAKLNGVLVGPGEEFSFNQIVGDISAATGYKTAYIIKDGRTVLGDGGGVCQDSTTLFRAILNAGLKITERHPHSYRVSYYEQNSAPGLDATVYNPTDDLKFVNDTPAYILIQTLADLSNNYLKIELYGMSDGRKAAISKTRLWDQVAPPAPLYQDDPTLPAGTSKQVDWAAWGAKASFDWTVTRGGEVLHQKTFYSNYQPWQAVYLRGTGS